MEKTPAPRPLSAMENAPHVPPYPEHICWVLATLILQKI